MPIHGFSLSQRPVGAMTGNKRGRLRRPRSALERGYFADFTGQVLSPTIE